MEPGTKAKLVLALVILLVIVLAIWWTAEKKKPLQVALVGIDYNPSPTPGQQHLIYTLAAPPPEGTEGQQATVTSFAAEGADINAAVVAALTTGSAAGGVPFVPTVSGATLSTNTVPAALVAATAGAVSLRGVGTIEFTPAPQK